MARYPAAAWRPLPESGTQGSNNPRFFIVHTMVGWNHGSEQWFRRADIKAESHFGIADLASREDPVRQWMDTAERADTNWDANGISVTVELEDRGDPTRPLTAFQIDQLVDLGRWALAAHPGIAPRLAEGPYGSGLGWHRMFYQWNRSNHGCPGAVREAQLKETVFPAILAGGGDLMAWKKPGDPVENVSDAQAVFHHQGSVVRDVNFAYWKDTDLRVIFARVVDMLMQHHDRINAAEESVELGQLGAAIEALANIPGGVDLGGLKAELDNRYALKVHPHSGSVKIPSS